MKKLLFALAILICVNGFAQLKIGDIKMEMKIRSLAGSLIFTEYPRSVLKVSYEDMEDSLKAFIQRSKLDDNIKFIKTNFTEVTSVFKNSYCFYLYDNKLNFPIEITKNVDNGICLCLSNIFETSIFNSYSKTPKQIAAKVAQDVLLEKLKAFDEVKNPLIKYYAVSCFYGIRNFLTDDEDKKEYQFIGLVAPKNAVTKFLNASITANEFIKLCDVYYDKDGFTFQKTTLVLE